MDTDLKKQLDEFSQKLEQVSKDVIKLTVINEHLYEERQNNNLKIETIKAEFSSAKGAISTLKWLIGMLSASAIGFCTWIVTSNLEQSKEITQLNQKVAMIEKELHDLENDK